VHDAGCVGSGERFGHLRREMREGLQTDALSKHRA
jgi:hypothetical protein